MNSLQFRTALSRLGTPSPCYRHQYQNKGLRSHDPAKSIIPKDLAERTSPSKTETSYQSTIFAPSSNGFFCSSLLYCRLRDERAHLYLRTDVEPGTETGPRSVEGPNGVADVPASQTCEYSLAFEVWRLKNRGSSGSRRTGGILPTRFTSMHVRCRLPGPSVFTVIGKPFRSAVFRIEIFRCQDRWRRNKVHIFLLLKKY